MKILFLILFLISTNLKKCFSSQTDLDSLAPEGPSSDSFAKSNKGYQHVAGPKGMSGWSGKREKKRDIGFSDPPGLPCPRDPYEQGIKGDKGYQGLDGLPGEKGIKGDKGYQGLDGLPGEKGDRGDQGVIGPMGMTGRSGKRGKKGDAGFPGLPCPKGVYEQGIQGEKGERGLDGLPGFSGEKGSKGDKGESGRNGNNGRDGFPGLPGIRGLDGVCTCPTNTRKDTESKLKRDVDPHVIDSVPIRRACKYIDQPIKNGYYNISKDQNPESSFEVYCDGTKTCIKPKTDSHTLSNKVTYITNEPFLLSSRGFTGLSSYNIDKEELQSLQQLSVNVVQHIKIHCMNSYVYHDGVNKKNSAVVFLTWNDLVLYPKDENPLFYYTTEKDECSNSGIIKDVWKVTEIVLKSGNSQRLPIRDVLVRDVRGEDQRIYVELGDLCFE